MNGLRRVATALGAIALACGGARPPPSVTVEPLPTPPPVASAAPLPPAPRAAHSAPEVLAPGKVTVVHFFATWCLPCEKSMPALDRVYRSRRPRVAAIAISEDDEEPGIKEFVAQYGPDLDARWDEQKTHATAWHVETMPTTYVVDQHGGLRFTHAGWHDADGEQIAREVDALLREP